MKPLLTIFSAILIAGLLLVSCDVEDPGPLQEVTREYAVIDFDQLEMGSGFRIDVGQSSIFSVTAKGDRRNINDLKLRTVGNTLVIEYDESATRRHDTYITIRMPELRSVHFSGGSKSSIRGFESDGTFSCYLSGGSLAQIDAGYRYASVMLSGGSTLRMYGLGDEISGEISGASELSAFDYPVRSAELNLTGASRARVTVSDELTVTASGASDLTYRGNPVVDKNVSGGSSVRTD
jgi:hypothetical protein